MIIALQNVEIRTPGREKPLFTLRSLSIPAGSRTLIHGHSGRGKTTLLNVIAGQFLPYAGSVRVDGHEYGEMNADSRARFRRDHVGIIFQRWNLVDHLTALENVLLGIPVSAPNAIRRKQAYAALQRTGLEELSLRPGGWLSPGEQQRVAAARVWASSPRLILADEPTSSLDDPGMERVMGVLWEASEGGTMVVVSHDPRLHALFRDRRDFADLVSA